MAFAAIGTFLGASAATAAATGAIAVGTVGSLGMGAAQMAKGGRAQKRAQANLEKQAANSPLYKPSKEVKDYYEEAKRKYAENPFQTPYYLENMKQSERAAAQSLGALQSRGAAVGGVSRVNRILQDAKNRNVASSMQYKNAEFSNLGQAAQMQNRENQQAFDINKVTPYNRQLQLEQMKAQAAAERYNAGMQSIGSGLSNLASFGINSAYGQDGFGKPRNKKTNYNNPSMYQGSVNDIIPYSDMG